MMLTLLLSVASAAPPAWVGQTSSQGGAPIELRMTQAAEDTFVAELLWLDYDRVTIEATVRRHPACGDGVSELRGRVDGVCSSVDEKVSDPHVVYDYVAQSRLRCVFGDDGAPAWCDLPYTGWFELRRTDLPDDPAARARSELLAAMSKADALFREFGEDGEVVWFDDQGRAVGRIERNPRGQLEVRTVTFDRGRAAYAGWGSGGLIYQIEALP